MTLIVAIDPGPEKSAWIVADARCGCINKILGKGIHANRAVMSNINSHMNGEPPIVGIEMVACYGMTPGASVFETCVEIGRFIEQLKCEPLRVYRKDVKMHLCQSMRAKDKNIRRALIDKYGEPGTVKNKGMLYGISTHLWAALGIVDYLASL